MMFRMLVLISTLLVGAPLVWADAPPMDQIEDALESEDFAGVESMCRAVLREEQDNARAWFLLGYALHAQGELDEAIFAHAAATRFDETKMLATYNLMCAYALKGDIDRAFEMMDSAMNLGMVDVGFYESDPDLGTLRDDPRWERMMMRAGSARNMGILANGWIGMMNDEAVATAMDFWVGTWDCTDEHGERLGRVVIEQRVSGLVVHERFRSIDGGTTGEAWSFMDPRTDVWKRTWISGSEGSMALVELEAKLMPDYDGLLFDGRTFSTDGSRETKRMRMHVRPTSDGRVKRTEQIWDREASEWVESRTMYYAPVERASSSEVGAGARGV